MSSILHASPSTCCVRIAAALTVAVVVVYLVSTPASTAGVFVADSPSKLPASAQPKVPPPWQLQPAVSFSVNNEIVPWSPELRGIAFSEPAYYWPSPVVIVPSVFDEFGDGLPQWVVRGLRNNGLNSSDPLRPDYSVYLYQKLDANSPHFCVNFGYEASTAFAFIAEHYDHLPDIMVFVHAQPFNHNKALLDWVACLRPGASFASLNAQVWVERDTRYFNNWIFEPYPFARRCWAYWLRRVGLNVSQDDAEPIAMSGECCAQFAVSRAQVRRLPLQFWADWYAVLQRGQSCEGDVPLDAAAPHGPYPATPFWLGKYVHGSAFEHLNHVIFGGRPLVDERPTQDRLCAQFWGAGVCPGSPCRE